MAEPARDGYSRYFAEKLWEMIPESYRHEDGLGPEAGTLRALVEIFADQAANLRRSQDALWDDQYIELAHDWAVPYIGDLVGTRMVEALDRRGRRADVANTIHYRRRKGTLLVIEQLVGDVSGWECAALEMLQRLARSWHGLDSASAGRVTRTPRGGFADLRAARSASLVDGAFDEFAHTLDPRRQRGQRGRHQPAVIALHLHRHSALRVALAEPRLRSDGVTFTFDPSGRDVPLYAARSRPVGDEWRRAREWELPRPISCRLLDEAHFVITEAVIESLVLDHGLPAAAATDLRTLRDLPLRDVERLRTRIATLPNAPTLLAAPLLQALLAASITDDSPKRFLYPDSVEAEEAPGVSVPREVVRAGDLRGWAASVSGARLVIDPLRGRGAFLGGAPVGPVLVSYHVGVLGSLGAGTFERRRELLTPSDLRSGGGALTGARAVLPDVVTSIEDNRTYGPVSDVLGVKQAAVQAANRTRPYVRLAGDWVFQASASEDSPALTIDGLWLGANANAALVLRGRFARVVLRQLTLDPGGIDADGNAIASVSLRIEGEVKELVIERSVLGPIATAAAGLVESLRLSDSIVDARGGDALVLDDGNAQLRRVTLLGAARLHRLDASEVLVAGTLDVVDTQRGCFRFSRAAAPSRAPHPFQSLIGGDDRAWFETRVFGEPGYAELSSVAPPEVVRGAENRSEIGAFSSEIVAIRLDSLHDKVEEYLPFGLVPVVVTQT